MARTTTVLLTAAALFAVMSGLSNARSVSVREAESEQFEIQPVESVVQLEDPNDGFTVSTDSDMDFDNSVSSRKKRLEPPTWSCRGVFAGDGNSYDVDCETNLEVVSTECTLDGVSYNCGGIDFSVDTSNFNDGEEHVLQINVNARYGNSNGRLRYTFRFRRQVTNLSIRCSSRPEGENLVITCTGTGISLIQYRINGSLYRNAGSTSSFTITGSELSEGLNTIGLRITANGVVRTTSLTAQKTSVSVFRPSCSISYDTSGNTVFRCSHDSEGEAIQTIRYSINGAAERTASSVSEFQINVDDLQVGDNIIALTFVSTSGSSVTRIFTVRKVQIITFSPSCSVTSQSDGTVAFTCSGGSDSIQSIRYSINGGSEVTTTSVSNFEVRGDQLVVGENRIRIIFVSSSGATRTITYTVRKTQSQVRSFSVRCGASYNSNNNADVECSTQSPDSEAIATIYYTVNGGSRQTATSVSGFEVNKVQLTREVNTIVVTLESTSGLTRDLTLNLVQPLSLRCNSETTSTGITISCQTNRDSSSFTVSCYLDRVRLPSCLPYRVVQHLSDLRLCLVASFKRDISGVSYTLKLTVALGGLNSEVDFSQVSRGRHIYEVVVNDSNRLTVRNQISFENRLSTSCRGSLNLGASVYSITCVSNRELQYQCFIDGQAVTCPENLHIDISQLQAGRHTLQLIGTDTSGNTATSTSQFTIPRELGSCVIDDDVFDGAIDWTCTTNVAGVSILCLVDEIKLEPCLCQLSSEFFTERYAEGDHKVSLILTGQDGSSKRFDQTFNVQRLVTSTSHAIEPLVFECISEPKEEYVKIDCVSNKPVDLTCYLDDEQHTPCLLTGNRVAFADITQGPHTFTVVAKDEDGLVDRSEVHFEEDLDISCRGSYNPGYDVVHLACDSTRPLANTECQLGDGASTQCPTPFDLPVDEFVNDLIVRVSAHDNVGNSDTDQLTFLTSSCESC